MARSAASPWNDAPYPTLVGTATTGREVSPATTDGNAPSMPAMTITQSASSIRARWSSSRWTPATPTSRTESIRIPRAAAVTSASSATGRSDVPADTTATVPRAAPFPPDRATISQDRSWYRASGATSRTASYCSGVARVTKTAPKARAARAATAARTSSGLFPGPYTAST